MGCFELAPNKKNKLSFTKLTSIFKWVWSRLFYIDFLILLWNYILELIDMYLIFFNSALRWPWWTLLRVYCCFYYSRGCLRLLQQRAHGFHEFLHWFRFIIAYSNKYLNVLCFALFPPLNDLQNSDWFQLRLVHCPIKFWKFVAPLKATNGGFSWN